MPKTHELKCWPGFYFDILAEVETAMFRKNDRDYQEGDYLILKLYDPKIEMFEGRSFVRQITHIIDHKAGIGIPEGYVVMSIRPLLPYIDQGST